MGAWDSGIFDDDTAYDFFDEIEANPKEFFKSSFEEAIKSDYVEYDVCHMVTVSAACIDNLLNGTYYRNDNEEEEGLSNVNNFKELKKDLEVDDLKLKAVQALNKVIGDNSELNELWEENDEYYPKWKNNLKALIGRLK